MSKLVLGNINNQVLIVIKLGGIIIGKKIVNVSF